jgi:hypothetical protein
LGLRFVQLKASFSHFRVSTYTPNGARNDRACHFPMRAGSMRVGSGLTRHKVAWRALSPPTSAGDAGQTGSE